MNRTRQGAAALVVGTFCALAQADLAIKPGPIDATHHFPSYVVDTANQPLQLCLDGDGLSGPCRFDPASSFAGNAWAGSTGFGAEAYYSQARSTLVMPSGRRGELSVGLKAAYASVAPADGKQLVSASVAYQIQVPGPGVYRVWHPYLSYPACLPEVHVVAVGQPLPAVISNVAERGAGAPLRSLANLDGAALLRWDPALAPFAPAGYVGDPTVAHTVVGSPCRMNVFRIEGPNIGGPGLFAAQTFNFNVAGKLYVNTTTAAPLVVDRASVFEVVNPVSTRVEVVGRTSPNTTVTLLPIAGLAPNTLTRSDANGNFYVQVTGASTAPSSIAVTTDPAQSQATVTVPTTDQVQVESAVYSATRQALTVVARSSFKAPPSTTSFPGLPPGFLLVTLGGGAPIALQPTATAGEYSAVIGGLATAPASVTVTSARGGRAVAEVQD